MPCREIIFVHGGADCCPWHGSPRRCCRGAGAAPVVSGPITELYRQLEAALRPTYCDEAELARSVWHTAGGLAQGAVCGGGELQRPCAGP